MVWELKIRFYAFTECEFLDSCILTNFKELKFCQFRHKHFTYKHFPYKTFTASVYISLA